MPKKRKIFTYTIDELSPEARARAIEKFREHAFDDHDATMLTEEFQTILGEKGILNAKASWSLGYCQGDGVCFTGNVDIPTVIEINKLEEFKPLVEIANRDDLHARILNEGSRYCHWNSMTVEVELNSVPASLLTPAQALAMGEWEYQKAQAIERYRREWFAVKERNLQPVRDYERAMAEWMKHGGATPQDWSPRFRHPGMKPPMLDEPYPPEPVFPRPPDLQAAFEAAEARWTGIETLANKFQEWLKEWVQGVSRELEKIGYAEIEYRQSDEAIIEFFNGNEWEFLEDGKRWDR